MMDVQVGDVFEGPWIGNGTPKVDPTPGKYYVRSVVDPEQWEGKWYYYVVMCYHTPHKGWRYKLEFSTSLESLYKRINKSRRAGRAGSVRSIA